MNLVKYRTYINGTIQLLASGGALYGLWLASHGILWWQKAIGVVLFALSNNTLFSLLHEAVHKIYSKNQWLNDAMGILASSFFPTGFTFQRLCHLAHHCNNRSDHEMFDMYYPHDNLLLKRVQFFGIFTGLYWLVLVVGWMIYLVYPGFFVLVSDLGKRSHILKHADVAILLPFGKTTKQARIRYELAFTLLFQILIFYLLQLTFVWWLLAYWVFSLFWGSLQYADHAFSPRNIRKGAWDLRINPIMRYIFLNYHHHRAHHMHPNVPWFDLAKHIDHDNYRPSFMEIYLRMWKGPIKTKEPAPIKLKESEIKDIYRDV
jgi:fatty acid desaturase